jgi:hypothetical protein
VPQYVGAPLFADIDRHLRGRGFEFHTFAGIHGRAFKPLVPRGDPYAPVRQMLWADAVYVRDFMRFAELAPGRLLALALILHEVYGSFDLAALALQHHDAKTKPGLWSAYMTRLLGGKTPPPPPPLEPV